MEEYKKESEIIYEFKGKLLDQLNKSNIKNQFNNNNSKLDDNIIKEGINSKYK